MLDEQALKERLRAIAAEDYKAPTRPEIYPLVLAMGTFTGTVDPELRDDLIYVTMAHWIERDIFEVKDLREILQVALNEQHLFLGLGEQGSDTVFTRSFSMLIIAAVLAAHRRRHFLPDEELQVIKRKLLRYLAGEKDWRGYVPVKGWAHAAAHAADALEELVQCSGMSGEDLSEILTSMRNAIGSRDTVYVCEEDERLVSAVLAAWQREEIDDAAISGWLEGLVPLEDCDLPFEKRYRSFVNSKNFLRSLTFRTERMPFTETVHLAMRQALLRFSRFQQ
jgi:hypothetical protein